MENTINQHGITDVYKTLPQTFARTEEMCSLYVISKFSTHISM